MAGDDQGDQLVAQLGVRHALPASAARSSKPSRSSPAATSGDPARTRRRRAAGRPRRSSARAARRRRAAGSAPSPAAAAGCAPAPPPPPAPGRRQRRPARPPRRRVRRPPRTGCARPPRAWRAGMPPRRPPPPRPRPRPTPRRRGAPRRRTARPRPADRCGGRPAGRPGAGAPPLAVAGEQPRPGDQRERAVLHGPLAVPRGGCPAARGEHRRRCSRAAPACAAAGTPRRPVARDDPLQVRQRVAADGEQVAQHLRGSGPGSAANGVYRAAEPGPSEPRSPGSAAGAPSQVQAGAAVLDPGRGHRVHVALAQQHVVGASSSTSARSSGSYRTRSPTATWRTCWPTATTAAQASRLPTAAVAGITMPDRTAARPRPCRGRPAPDRAASGSASGPRRRSRLGRYPPRPARRPAAPRTPAPRTRRRSLAERALRPLEGTDHVGRDPAAEQSPPGR